ncbi:OmpA/MotB family protein [Planctomonas psychrotolerans]|uniref:OmpA/MotB family protein n=1 Tax=Planctomonas psychrotolerans TaxID=2528712 RepID=UPI00123AFC41|nr:flagellar motor protein MotB [Planctomonas psychrotolerans]
MSGRVRGRSRGQHEEAEEHPDERWMASYMDMITVLMCLFLVLFAMSTVDQEKYVKLRDSLATGFGAVEMGAVDTAEGIVVPAELLDEENLGLTDAELAAIEVHDLQAIQSAIAESLAAKGLSESVAFEITERGLTVRLVGSETFFDSNSAVLSAQARQVLDSVSPAVSGSPRDVSVEGHADMRSTAAPYPTNWELSAARATGVLRDMVERGGEPQERIQAVGFGAARPLAAGTGAAELALNRRVDIVVLSSQSQDVNALLPGVAAGEDAGTPEAPPKEEKKKKPVEAAKDDSHGSGH